MNFTFLLGTFAGPTTLSIALVLPEDAQIVTVDFKDDRVDWPQAAQYRKR